MRRSSHDPLQHANQLPRALADGGAQTETLVESGLHARGLGGRDALAVAGRRVLLAETVHVRGLLGCGDCPSCCSRVVGGGVMIFAIAIVIVTAPDVVEIVVIVPFIFGIVCRGVVCVCGWGSIGCGLWPMRRRHGCEDFVILARDVAEEHSKATGDSVGLLGFGG